MPPTADKNQGQSSLAELLENDWLLTMVLEKLVDDGLDECRRVCRRWRHICLNLTTKLTVHHTDEIILPIIQKFPQVTEVCILSAGSNKHPPQANKLSLTLKSEHLLADIEQLSIIESVSLEAVQLWSKIICEYQIEQGADAFYPELIQYFTNLTALSFAQDTENTSPPFTELKKLAKLKIHGQFYTANGEFLFPAATQLTQLEIDIDDTSRLEVVPKFNTLRRMNLSLVQEDLLHWQALSNFAMLESLQIGPVSLLLSNLLKILIRIQSLIDLDVQSVDQFSYQIKDELEGLSNLKKLKVAMADRTFSRIEHEEGFAMRTLHQLTYLSITNWVGFRQDAFSSLLLRELDITGSMYAFIHLVKAMQDLPQLESLSLTANSARFWVSSSFLTNLSNLTSLSTSRVQFDLRFFKHLASLPLLRKLSWIDGDLNQKSAALEINTLTNLEQLTFGLTHQQPLQVIEDGTLIRLKYLNLPQRTISEDERESFVEKLPCLRKINGQKI